MDSEASKMECDVNVEHNEEVKKAQNDVNMNIQKQRSCHELRNENTPGLESATDICSGNVSKQLDESVLIECEKAEAASNSAGEQPMSNISLNATSIEKDRAIVGSEMESKNALAPKNSMVIANEIESQCFDIPTISTKDDTKSEENLEEMFESLKTADGSGTVSNEDNKSKTSPSKSISSPNDCLENGDIKTTPCSSASVSTSATSSPLSCGGKSAVDDAVLLELEQALSDSGLCGEPESEVSGFPSPWRHQVPLINCQGASSIDESTMELDASTPIKEVQDLQQKVESMQHLIEKMNKETDKARDDHYVQVQSLERTLAVERTRHQQQDDTATRLITQLRLDLEKKHQQLEVASKDRESMVVKYAMSEKSVITTRRDLEMSERRLKEANRARDVLSERLKVVQSEKEKASNLLETKGQEVSTCNRENQRLKEDLRWTQNKLKTEVESKKEAEQRVTDLIRRLEEARQEAEQARKDAQTAIKAFQESQENKAVTLDQQLREQQARLILERHERADSEGVMKQLQAEVETLKKKQQALITENNQLSVKVQTLEKERLDGDQRVSRLKRESDTHQQEVADLRARIAGIESLRAQLQHCEEQLAAGRSEMERLRHTNLELQQDAAACREREAELLDFTQKLTEKNVRLQSEFSATEAKAQMLESEQAPLQRRLMESETRTASLSKQLEGEQEQREEEKSLLARHLAERTHRAQQLQQQLEDAQGEIEVMKRKHATSLRELTRELQQVRKRLESAENNGSRSSDSTSLGQGSRASSTSSLNTVCETAPPTPVMPVFANGQEPDRQVLIERLVRLQRENARRAEKLDFLEEHVQTLVAELQKKSRIIQSYVMKAPAGALSSDSMDQNKAELAKRSGIMASMYGSKPDGTMTLELSMEINRKLQAVLEDTLLKNITLKESIDTLGGEIARLSSK